MSTFSVSANLTGASALTSAARNQFDNLIAWLRGISTMTDVAQNFVAVTSTLAGESEMLARAGNVLAATATPAGGSALTISGFNTFACITWMNGSSSMQPFALEDV